MDAFSPTIIRCGHLFALSKRPKHRVRASRATQCFAPVAAVDARVLILGSVPGQASLQAVQYYAHPRNAFWPIMGELFGAAPECPYPERLQQLKRHGIALWDVLASCSRPGSLDADIDDATIIVNDFAKFFGVHPHIRRIVFNGTMAEHCFRRYADPQQSSHIAERWRLPSTSPAHAAMAYRDKLERWREALVH